MGESGSPVIVLVDFKTIRYVAVAIRDICLGGVDVAKRWLSKIECVKRASPQVDEDGTDAWRL